MDKHLLKEYHENLKKEKQLQEERTKCKLQLRKELKDQIKFREYIIVSLIMLCRCKYYAIQDIYPIIYMEYLVRADE